MGLFSSIGSLFGGGGSAIGGIVDGIGGLVGSSHDNASIGRAGADRIGGYDAGIDTLKGGLTDIRSILQPYLSQGGAAVNQLGTLLGLGGDTAGAMAGLKDNPVYKALFGNAQQTVLQNASATGGLRGGNTQDALGHVGADTLAQVYQMMVGNLGNLSQLGAQTGMGFGALENNNVGAQANAQVGRGNAAATMVLDKIGLGADNKSGVAPSGGIGGNLGDIGQIFGGLQSLFGKGGGTDWDAVHAAIPF